MREYQTKEPPVITARRSTSAADAFQSYLHDISRLDLRNLTPDEEIDLGQRIAAGNEMARRKLIESNLRLVIAIARQYSNAGVPLVDLIQEGNLGVRHKKCAPTMDVSTYHARNGSL